MLTLRLTWKSLEMIYLSNKKCNKDENTIMSCTLHGYTHGLKSGTKVTEKRQSFKHVDSVLDTLEHYNKTLKRNAWLERDEGNDLWIIVWNE